MRLKIDRGNDALYLRLDESAIVESQEVESGIILDFDGEGRLVGIEVLSLSTRTDPAALRVFQLESL